MKVPCNCVETVDAMLADRNTRLRQPFYLDAKEPFRLFVETEQVETGRGKKKKSAMFASHCPFCGAKYLERQA